MSSRSTFLKASGGLLWRHGLVVTSLLLRVWDPRAGGPMEVLFRPCAGGPASFSLLDWVALALLVCFLSPLFLWCWETHGPVVVASGLARSAHRASASLYRHTLDGFSRLERALGAVSSSEDGRWRDIASRLERVGNDTVTLRATMEMVRLASERLRDEIVAPAVVFNEQVATNVCRLLEALSPLPAPAELATQHAVLGQAPVVEDLADKLNAMTVDYLDSLTMPVLGYDTAVLVRTQARGADVGLRWAFDEPLFAAVRSVLLRNEYGRLMLASVSVMAKLVPNRRGKLIAIIKHVAAVSAVPCWYREHVDSFLSWVWKWELGKARAADYHEALDLVRPWEKTGAWEFLGALGLEPSRHPGYPYSKGFTKRQASESSAALIRAVRQHHEDAEDSDLWRDLVTLLHGGRTKRLFIAEPIWISHAAQQLPIRPGVLNAPRVFTFANLGCVAAAKPLQLFFTESNKRRADANFVWALDSFRAGAVRMVLRRIHYLGIHSYSRLNQLLEDARWGEELPLAESHLAALPREVLREYMDSAWLSEDLSGSDAHSSISGSDALIAACLERLHEVGGAPDEFMVEVLRRFERSAAAGNVVIEGAVRRFTRDSTSDRERAWIEALEPRPLESSAEDATLSSGSLTVYARNCASQALCQFPFASFPGSGVFEGASAALRQLVLDPPDGAFVPAHVTTAEVGSDAWVSDVVRYYAPDIQSADLGAPVLIADIGGDDGVTGVRAGDCRCGRGRANTVEHASCNFPPAWLKARARAAAGKAGSHVEPTVTSATYFHKRAAVVEGHEGAFRTVMAVDATDLVCNFVHPDKPRMEPRASLVRLAKVIVAYPHAETFWLLAEVLRELLQRERWNLASPIFLPLAAGENPGCLPEFVKLGEVMATCERLYGVLRASERVPDVFSTALHVAMVAGMLVAWCADAGGEEACKIVHEAGQEYALHGLWSGAYHTHEAQPWSGKSHAELEDSLPEYLKHVFPTRLSHEYEVHAVGMESPREYGERIANFARTVDPVARVHYVRVRNLDGPDGVVQAIGIGYDDRPLLMEGLPPGLDHYSCVYQAAMCSGSRAEAFPLPRRHYWSFGAAELCTFFRIAHSRAPPEIKL